jgi:hypothetical protein
MAVATPDIGENAIELITADRGPHYEPFGWHHWPEHPWLAYQFRRGLGETQEGGGSASEVMQAGSRMIPAISKAGMQNGCPLPIATGHAGLPKRSWIMSEPRRTVSCAPRTITARPNFIWIRMIPAG